MSHQPQLDFEAKPPSTARPAVKKVQLKALRAAWTVCVDYEQCLVAELRGDEVIKYDLDTQTVVLGEAWLDNLKAVVAHLREMRDRHQCEERYLIDLVREILSQSASPRLGTRPEDGKALKREDIYPASPKFQFSFSNVTAVDEAAVNDEDEPPAIDYEEIPF